MSNSNSCDLCKKGFKSKFSLKRHYRNLHPGTILNLKESKKHYNLLGDLKCSICHDSFNHTCDFSDHLLKVHDILLKSEHLIFQSDTEFHKWKKFIESRLNVLYIKPRGARLSNGGKVEYFQCHRSGNYKNKISNRQRELKIQGSSKIDAYCPSKIKAVYSSDGIVTVDYCETHVGHKLELIHVLPSTYENIEEESDVASKRPFEVILDVVEANVVSDRENKKNVNNQNISVEIPLHSENQFYSNDAPCIEDWIEKERIDNKNHCILLYKPKGKKMHDYPLLNEEDFVLGIMNEAQAQTLRKYGGGCICIDSFCGSNTYNFSMIILVVLDELRQGHPCAFYFSNRNDCASFETFLSAIKEKIGIISTAVVMADMGDTCYKPWEKIMGSCPQRLFCSWYLQQVWKKRINLIKNDVKRRETYQKILTLQNELGETAFEIIFPMIVKELFEDSETVDFGKYFQDNFSNNCKSWAHCYRKNAGLVLNFDLERLHCIFKHFYLKGKLLNRLDITLHAVKQFNYSKRFDHFIENREVPCKLRDLRARHKRSLALSIDDVVASSDNIWTVFTSSPFQVFTVTTNDITCGCSLNCRFCNACIHKFNCTCIDACVKWNMCKHIHLVCRRLQSVENMEKVDHLILDVINEEIVHSDVSSNDTKEGVNGNIAIMEVIYTDVVDNSFSIESSKQEISDHFFSLLNQVTSFSEVEVFRKTIKYLETQLQTFSKEKCLNFAAANENNVNVL